MNNTASFSLEFARKRPLLAFVFLVFAFSWLFWLIPWGLGVADPVASRHLVALGAFAPSLAAVALTYLLQTERPALRWDWFMLALPVVGILYIFCLPYASALPSQVTTVGWIARILLWAAPAVLAAAALSDKGELRGLLLPNAESAQSPVWYAAALMFFPVIFGTGYALSKGLGEPIQVRLSGNAGEIALTVGATFIYILLFGGAMGEESGLRRFVLPRLQERFSPLIASLIIALGWTVWNIPLQVIGYYPDNGSPVLDLLVRSLFTLLSILALTWLYNRTRNLTACVLLHAGFTTCSILLPPTNAVIGILTAAVLAMILEGRMWESDTEEDEPEPASS